MRTIKFKLPFLFLLIPLTGCISHPSDNELTTEQSASIPANCVSWFDGCNTCTVKNNAPYACTLKMCDDTDKTKAKCLTFVSVQQQAKIPEKCVMWFDGCNRCMVKNGIIQGCTKMACNKNESMPKSSCLKYAE